MAVDTDGHNTPRPGSPAMPANTWGGTCESGLPRRRSGRRRLVRRRALSADRRTIRRDSYAALQFHRPHDLDTWRALVAGFGANLCLLVTGAAPSLASNASSTNGPAGSSAALPT